MQIVKYSKQPDPLRLELCSNQDSVSNQGRETNTCRVPKSCTLIFAIYLHQLIPGICLISASFRVPLIEQSVNVNLICNPCCKTLMEACLRSFLLHKLDRTDETVAQCYWNCLRFLLESLTKEGQGCSAFTEGCLMGGLDPNTFLRCWNKSIWKKQKQAWLHGPWGDSNVHLCLILCFS